MKHEYNTIHKNIQYTFILTNTAKKQIEKLIYNGGNKTIGLRISIKTSGCAGLRYAFDKVNEKNFSHSDLVFKYKNNVKLFISYKDIQIINGTELDYVQDGLNHMFKFKNPKALHLCGCGESFNI